MIEEVKKEKNNVKLSAGANLFFSNPSLKYVVSSLKY